MKTRKLLPLLAVVMLAACSGPSTPPAFVVTPVDAPVNGTVTSPRLAAGPDGQLTLSWLQTDTAAVALNYANYRDGEWRDASTVAQVEDMFVNWADLPSVVPLAEKRLAAHWMVLTGAHGHAYDIFVSESANSGATWSTPMTPHTDGTDTEHGFVSIYDDKGETGLLWLDGRKMVNEVTDDPVASGMTLRSNKQVVDELVCDCCQTDVTVASSGPIAVYRDRSVDEIRDIYITRLIDGEWQSGIPVANDGWEIWGCPVNGPSIAADGDRVAVAWFTAAEDPLVNLAISSDSGATFSAPIEIVRGETMGRAAIAMLDDGVAVSWLKSTEAGGSEVRVKKVNSDGSAGADRVISSSASSFSVPQMLRQGSDLVFAWTEAEDADNSTIKSARVAIKAL